jgi:hypothetical protein
VVTSRNEKPLSAVENSITFLEKLKPELEALVFTAVFSLTNIFLPPELFLSNAVVHKIKAQGFEFRIPHI